MMDSYTSIQRDCVGQIRSANGIPINLGDIRPLCVEFILKKCVRNSALYECHICMSYCVGRYLHVHDSTTVSGKSKERKAYYH